MNLSDTCDNDGGMDGCIAPTRLNVTALTPGNGPNGDFDDFVFILHTGSEFIQPCLKVSKVGLEPVAETIGPASLGKTCALNTIEEVATVLDSAVVGKGIDASMSEGTAEAFE
jgi:hypothetical protein